MLGARELVDADVVRNVGVAFAGGLGRITRSGGLPVFDVAHGMDDLRTGVGFPAAVEQAARLSGDGIVRAAVGQRRFRSGILLLGMLRPGQAPRLREAHIDVVAYRTDMRLHPLENLPALFVLVEAEVEIGAQQAPTLRDAVEERVPDLPGQRVGRAIVVLGRVMEERSHVADRRQPQPHHDRVLGGVHQLVDVVGVEAVLEADLLRVGYARERRGVAVGEGPVAIRDHGAWIVLMHPHRHGEPGVARGDAGVAGRVRAGFGEDVLRARRRAHRPFRAHRPGDRAAAALMRDGRRHGDVCGRHQIGLPAGPDQRQP